MKPNGLLTLLLISLVVPLLVGCSANSKPSNTVQPNANTSSGGQRSGNTSSGAPGSGVPGSANPGQQLQTPLARSSAAPVIDQSPVLEAQAQQLRHKQVTIGATVLKTLPDDTKGIRHQRFLIALDNGTSVLIAHNIDIAPHIPIEKGDYLVICGEYIWNEKGGVIHWTHRSDNPYHPGGYIDFSGKRYQ